MQGPIRIGEPTSTMVMGGRISRNWSADATIDEFYLWKGDHLGDAQELWSRGRYYSLPHGPGSQYTSKALKLARRRTPATSPPLRATAAAARRRLHRDGRAEPGADPRRRLDLGTPEKHGKNGETQIVDYRNLNELTAQVTLQMIVNKSPVGEPLRAEGGSPIRGLWATPGRAELSPELPAAGRGAGLDPAGDADRRRRHDLLHDRRALPVLRALRGGL
jgi:hypothetical protein